MASNDTLDLILDDPDVVAWDRITPMIRQVEQTMLSGAMRVTVTRGSPRSLSPVPWHSRPPTAAIAAPVRRGSVVIPLLFLADRAHDAMLAIGEVPAGAFVDPLKEWLSTLADVTDIFDFTLGYLFGRCGVVAKLRGTAQPPLDKTEEMQSRLADLSVDDARAWLDDLVKVAGQMPVASVRLRYRDMEFELNMTDGALSPTNLGRAERHIMPNPPPGLDLAGPMQIQREGRTIQVEFEGAEYTAFKTTMNPIISDIILVWASKSPIPQNTPMEVTGEYVDRQHVRPLEAVPAEWRRANGVFVVRGARQAGFH